VTDKKSSESRRKLLKSIAAGTGVVVAGKSLPENWTKPVVDSVMLPAHAQTSPVSKTCPEAGTGSTPITLIVQAGANPDIVVQIPGEPDFTLTPVTWTGNHFNVTINDPELGEISQHTTLDGDVDLAASPDAISGTVDAAWESATEQCSTTGTFSATKTTGPEDAIEGTYTGTADFTTT
jgi:hypothetical protein